MEICCLIQQYRVCPMQNTLKILLNPVRIVGGVRRRNGHLAAMMLDIEIDSLL